MKAQEWKYQARRAGRAVFMGLLGALALVPHPSWFEMAVGATFGLATMWFVDRAKCPKASS